MNIVEQIYDIIEKVTGSCYTSGLDVINNDDEWVLKLDMNQSMAPLTMAYQGTKEGFLEFVEQEFRSRGMDRVEYWTAQQISTGDGNIYLTGEYGKRAHK